MDEAKQTNTPLTTPSLVDCVRHDDGQPRAGGAALTWVGSWLIQRTSPAAHSVRAGLRGKTDRLAIAWLRANVGRPDPDLLTHLHENSFGWEPVVRFYLHEEFVIVELQRASTRATADHMNSLIEALGHTATVINNTLGLRYGFGLKVSA